LLSTKKKLLKFKYIFSNSEYLVSPCLRNKEYQIFLILECLKKLLILSLISSRSRKLHSYISVESTSYEQRLFFTACYSRNTINFNTLVLVHIVFPCNESYYLGNEILPLPFQYLYLYLLNCYWGTILETGLMTTLQIIKS